MPDNIDIDAWETVRKSLVDAIEKSGRTLEQEFALLKAINRDLNPIGYFRRIRHLFSRKDKS